MASTRPVSSLKYYIWSATLTNRSSDYFQLVQIAFSEDEARDNVLSFFDQIESLRADYKDLLARRDVLLSEIRLLTRLIYTAKNKDNKVELSLEELKQSELENKLRDVDDEARLLEEKVEGQLFFGFNAERVFEYSLDSEVYVESCIETKTIRSLLSEAPVAKKFYPSIMVGTYTG
jgi:hypothetical protein